MHKAIEYFAHEAASLAYIQAQLEEEKREPHAQLQLLTKQIEETEHERALLEKKKLDNAQQNEVRTRETGAEKRKQVHEMQLTYAALSSHIAKKTGEVSMLYQLIEREEDTHRTNDTVSLKRGEIEQVLETCTDIAERLLQAENMSQVKALGERLRNAFSGLTAYTRNKTETHDTKNRYREEIERKKVDIESDTRELERIAIQKKN